MKQIVRFPINTPTQVALETEAGKYVEGRYGEQVLYSLVGDRVMYVRPIVDQRIRELAIAAGERFEIVKHEVKDGTRRSVQWRVTRLPQQPDLTADAPAADGAIVSEEAGDAKPENTKTNGRADPATGNARTAAEADPAAAASNLPAIPEQITGSGIRAMELALNGAAEIAQRVESRAASKGYSLRFTSDDIRAIGLTIFIQAMREALVGWQR
jgi:hypothetical protein